MKAQGRHKYNRPKQLVLSSDHLYAHMESVFQEIITYNTISGFVYIQSPFQ